MMLSLKWMQYGAHLSDGERPPQGRAEESQLDSGVEEYAKSYNRLKQRKQQRKIGTDEWNATGAKA